MPQTVSLVENIDCIDYMMRLNDDFFELAILDPPYGGGQKFNFRFRDESGSDGYENVRPGWEYFYQVRRVSKNQIIWGGNYFTKDLPESRGWLCWYKGQPLKDFSDFELAWTSFDMVSRMIDLKSYGFNHADKRHSGQSTIHPTQKPIALYRWLLQNYAKPGDKIFDSHMGSQSSRIAAYDMGFDYYGCELDPDYFKAGCKRFDEFKLQQKLF